MTISVSVTNNEASAYTGRIRVFVTEINSTMGWNDSNGDPYNFCFLDYAFNEDINIAAGATWSSSTSWNGNLHDDGYGNDFGSITYDNIMVIAAVYDSTVHQGYSAPPNGYPFDAYYVDETVGARPGIIIDNLDPQFIITAGYWPAAAFGKAYATTLRYKAPGNGGKIAAWRADTILLPGYHDVYVWKFYTPVSTLYLAPDAKYQVVHRYGISGPYIVDWTQPGNEWVYLGNFYFNNATPQAVALNDLASKYIIADAVKYVYTGQ